MTIYEENQSVSLLELCHIIIWQPSAVVYLNTQKWAVNNQASPQIICQTNLRSKKKLVLLLTSDIIMSSITKDILYII